MSEQDGSPSELPGGDQPPSRDAERAATASAPADATGPIERSRGGRMFAGRYQLLTRRGTATDVALFEAIDTETDRSVAVKIVHPDLCAADGFTDRFMATMGSVIAARHPNLTEVIDIGTATWSGRTVHFVVCENLTGGSLRDLRDRGRQLSASQVVMIGLDACRGLDAAHRAGFVHGDIRPANLVFGADGRLRLADVGLARLVSDAWWVEPTGVNIEKAKFASPEQAQGQEPTVKSDVYALCLCLLEAVTGHLPFVGDSSVATLSNRVDKLLPVSADLGPLAAVLERAGRPDPDDRSSAAEFGRALHQAAEKLPRPAPLALVADGLFASARPGTDQTSPTGILRRPDVSGATDAASAASAASAVETAVAAETAGSGPRLAVVPTTDDAPTDGPAGETPAVAVDGVVPDSPDSPSGSDGPEGRDASGSSAESTSVPTPWLPESTRAVPVAPVAPTLSSGAATSAAGVAASEASEAVDPSGRDGSTADGVAPASPASPVLASVAGASGASGTAPTTGAAADADATVSLREVLRPAGAAGDGDPEGDGSTPPRRRRVRLLLMLLLIALLAAAAFAGYRWWSNRTETNAVPDLTSLEQGEALNMISEFGWNVITISEADDDVAAGVVLRTDPAAGVTLDEGADITLVVSTGPAPRVLPEIIGATVEQATADLLELGLVLEIGERAASDDVPVDQVISWTVPDQPSLQAGDTVLPGTPIVVVVSSGPAPRVVPELSAVPLADATSLVEAVDLVIAVTLEEFSNDVPAGSVIAQDPVAGIGLAPGSTVSVVVSKGPDLVAVPSLAGLGVQEATDALAAAGLVIGTVSGDPAGVNVLATVDGVSIGGGATFPRGTAIDLTFEVPAPPPTEVPVV